MCLSCSYMYWSSFTTITQFCIMESPYFIFHVCVFVSRSVVSDSLWPHGLQLPSPCSSSHGIFQAIILEWVSMPSSTGFSQPRGWTQVSHIARRFFTIWITRETLILHTIILIFLSCVSVLCTLSFFLFDYIISLRLVGCFLFCLWFTLQKFLSLIKSHLFIFAFISTALGDWLRKYWYNFCQRMLCLCSLLGVLWCHALYLSL